MSSLNLYRSYNFVDKDPVLELVRDMVDEAKLPYAKISHLSGVSESTLYNWFHGKTRKPQFATVAAVMGGLGYRMVWERARVGDGDSATEQVARMRQHLSLSAQ